MGNIEKELSDIVGYEHVSADLADLVVFERDDQFAIVPPHRPDYVVRPNTVSEIQKILKLANQNHVPVVPLSADINRKGLCIAHKGGIILDLRRMNRILEVDEEMMVATIEPAVTVAQLQSELAKKGLKIVNPGAPATCSYLANCMLRGIHMVSFKYGIDHLITLEVVLPNGNVVDTGSGAMPNVPPYFNFVNGPDLTKLFQASPGNLGGHHLKIQ